MKVQDLWFLNFNFVPSNGSTTPNHFWMNSSLQRKHRSHGASTDPLNYLPSSLHTLGVILKIHCNQLSQYSPVHPNANTSSYCLKGHEAITVSTNNLQSPKLFLVKLSQIPELLIPLHPPFFPSGFILYSPLIMQSKEKTNITTKSRSPKEMHVNNQATVHHLL